jgi:hypothetical protein
MWHVFHKEFNPKYIKRFPREKTLGVPSKNGTVRPISYKGNSLRFVSKEVPREKLNIFKKELLVGHLLGVEKFGPRILAYRVLPDRGEYIMDNFLRGRTGLKVLTLDQFKKKYGRVPVIIWKMLYKSLLSFYQITRGYHGDLHTNNIAIIMRGGKPVQIQIYDYGTWRPFTKRIVSQKLTNYLNAEAPLPTNEEVRNGTFLPRGGGQLYRMNVNVLQDEAVKAFLLFNGK